MVKVIRRALPEDARFLALSILMATRSHLPRGWFDISLNRHEGDCLEFVRHLTLAKRLSPWHYSRFVVLEECGRKIGTVSAFRAREAYHLATSAMMDAIKMVGLDEAEAVAVWERSVYMFKCTMRPDDDSWVIEILATIPDVRGRGYGSELLSYALEQGRSEGCKQAEVSLFIGNEVAERAYMKFGFVLKEERRDAIFQGTSGAPGLRKYVKML